MIGEGKRRLPRQMSRSLRCDMSRWWTVIAVLICFARPGTLEAQWWGGPDQVEARCMIEPEEVRQHSTGRLRVQMQATDSKGHRLSYVWAANGGVIRSAGPGGEPAVGPVMEIDASDLNPGLYTVVGVSQDAGRNRAECLVEFLVLPPLEPLGAACRSELLVLEQGGVAELKVEATGNNGSPLEYHWFTNGGELQAERTTARLDTTGLRAGDYSVTARLQDSAGQAADCATLVRVLPPEHPPLPEDLASLSQVLFFFNRTTLGEVERRELAKLAGRVSRTATGRISVEAYAGPDERDPQNLAAARGEVVKGFLIENGVAEDRVMVLVGLGGRLGGERNRTLDVIWVPDGMDY